MPSCSPLCYPSVSSLPAFWSPTLPCERKKTKTLMLCERWTLMGWAVCDIGLLLKKKSMFKKRCILETLTSPSETWRSLILNASFRRAEDIQMSESPLRDISPISVYWRYVSPAGSKVQKRVCLRHAGGWRERHRRGEARQRERCRKEAKAVRLIVKYDFDEFKVINVKSVCM